jgi:hypothetical protein
MSGQSESHKVKKRPQNSQWEYFTLKSANTPRKNKYQTTLSGGFKLPFTGAQNNGNKDTGPKQEQKKEPFSSRMVEKSQIHSLL